MKQSNYIRKGVFNLNEVLDFVPTPTKHKFVGIDKKHYTMNMNSDRYKLFKNGGCNCAFCGLQGLYFALETHRVNNNPNGVAYYHFNLYGIKNGREIMLTKDHILPLSIFKNNKQDNLQILCSDCNSKKGALIVNNHDELLEKTKKAPVAISKQLKHYKFCLNRKYKNDFIINTIIKYPSTKKYFSTGLYIYKRVIKVYKFFKKNVKNANTTKSSI